MLDVVQRPVCSTMTGSGASSLQPTDVLNKVDTSSHRIEEGHKMTTPDSEIIQQH